MRDRPDAAASGVGGEVLGRQVAVKVLASRLASDRAFRHRIRIEAQAAARLCHPNITNVYDYGESEQVGLTVPYVVMELIDGESLSGRLRRGGQLPWREAVTIGAEVSSALATSARTATSSAESVTEARLRRCPRSASRSWPSPAARRR